MFKPKLKSRKGLKGFRGVLGVGFKRLLERGPVMKTSGISESCSIHTRPDDLPSQSGARVHRFDADKAKALQAMERSRRLF